jgi:cytochrome c biogenesis protein CcmG/thiol:disulfide interchange protein DsbE
LSEAESGLDSGAGRGEEGGGRRRWLVYLPFAIFVVVALAFAILIATGRNTEVLPSALINQPAPQFDLPPLEGLAFADGSQVPGFSTETLAGQVTVVNVWASWCVPCRQEHPYVAQLSADPRFPVYGIDHTDTTDAALQFLNDLGNPYDAVGVDPRQRVSIDWGVYGVPETFILDRNGIIRHKVIGPLTEDTLQNEVMPVIEDLLAEAPARP